MRFRATHILLAVPLVAFLGLAAIFALRVTDGADRSVVPSALIGKSAPGSVFPGLGVGAGFDPAALAGRVSLVNVFASWCAPCRVEHPLLMDLGEEEGLTIVGINYKDKRASAERFLAELGNPYDAIGVDPDGRNAIEWGVYGVPETFIVGPDGTIRGKHVGPLSREALDGSFGDTLRGLLEANKGAAAS
ncbi:DsbE family thiol:disulfide interchange protein [Acuticoccus sp. M5D2P5]|uniref:DsbE family thiol:disulfide interchange protein n=1 Tax=Acuticoccus kalidii TaxID=2910977 RepID=UPI001F421C7A|nr:DsbE family thiol:disulfide interchange protein [Acuticoccus kalidii]MCF3936043.1 DsbE family thiol:disulfide interchange protein [Acuticoccus kalidii]